MENQSMEYRLSAAEKERQFYKDLKHLCTQTAAYFLAKKDNFQKSPEHYWLEAEKNL